jgi:hypothetical protein
MGEEEQGTLPKVQCNICFSIQSAELMRNFRYSPANYVHKWSTPQLLIHGSKDYRLPETEGIGAFHALQQYVYTLMRYQSHLIVTRRRSVPSRLVIFPDENHWVLNHGNRFVFNVSTFGYRAEFFQTVLSGIMRYLDGFLNSLVTKVKYKSCPNPSCCLYCSCIFV